ncbi:lipopolysaccharide biosynthesis protein [Antarcticibacterium sp. 1MA-6-2]|uniref:lipopolysaccharide biosynthesis protein n=1 Tax=Antarcticibacterium sp. 1MA-6-2 TaxID=2908210 RepID=UPI001F2128F3|nr:lipopolysaccharide biosynthesis protein [Antarcticibacterium sp. 1MA-6-2]UJH91280.1 lipopolysaccharide biosynthesis protein [Antarcticibacterium sp. 1MA-6-2]
MSLKKTAITGLIWTFSQQFGNQMIGFVVSLILARILLPEEFGLIGMIAIFVALGNLFSTAGLSQSLIRSSDFNQEDYSTVFFFNLAASILAYFLLFFSAPLIASFYSKPILIPIVRVQGLSFIFSAFATVQLARLTKEMDFKTQTLVAIPAAIFGGIVGVVMAYTGYGVWSLVGSSLITTAVSTTLLWIYSGWMPSLIFNVQKFREHFSFGYKLTVSGFLNKIFDNIYLIVIGKYFTAAQVGFYSRAETTKQLPVTNISVALNRVTYPLFANIKDDNIRLKRVYKQLMQMVVFVVAPVLVILAVLAELVFRFLFTEKWLPAVPYFQILCAISILYPIHAYNLNVLNVKGRSDLFLKLEIYKKILIAAAIVVTLKLGIIALLYGQVVVSIFAFFINTHYTGKFIDYSGFDQTKDILPILFYAALSGAVVFFIDTYTLLKFGDIVRILVGGFIGLGIYLGTAHLFKNSSFLELLNLFQKRKPL